MKVSKLIDGSFYLLAGLVIFAVVAAFVNQLSDGATAEEYVTHYEKVSEPIIMTATEAAEAHLAEANKPVRSAVGKCVNGVCDKTKQVKANQPVRSVAKACSQRVRRGIFARWRNR